MHLVPMELDVWIELTRASPGVCTCCMQVTFLGHTYSLIEHVEVILVVSYCSSSENKHASVGVEDQELVTLVLCEGCCL